MRNNFLLTKHSFSGQQVGNEMVNNGMARVKILLYILTLGFITPIGTIVGIVLTLNSSDAVGEPQSIVVGVLQVKTRVTRGLRALGSIL